MRSGPARLTQDVRPSSSQTMNRKLPKPVKPMKTKDKFFICPQYHPLSAVCVVAIVLQFGMLAGYAQTGTYLFTGSETTLTLNPGTYDITAYGA